MSSCFANSLHCHLRGLQKRHLHGAGILCLLGGQCFVPAFKGQLSLSPRLQLMQAFAEAQLHFRHPYS